MDTTHRDKDGEVRKGSIYRSVTKSPTFSISRSNQISVSAAVQPKSSILDYEVPRAIVLPFRHQLDVAAAMFADHFMAHVF